MHVNRAEAPVPADTSLHIETIDDLRNVIDIARSMQARGVMITVRVVVASDGHAGLLPHHIQLLRRALPGALISLDPADTSYPPYRIREIARAARAAGAPSQVMIRWDLGGSFIISALQQVTVVGVWNDPRIAAPLDLDAEMTRLRAIGVRGPIMLQRR